MSRIPAGPSTRLRSVQTPVIAIVSRWIAETPDTISLGQGLVSYGPPAQAVEAARRFGASADDHRYGPIEGLPGLVDRLDAKLARENRIAVRPSSRLVVTAGGNQAFMNAVLAVTDPGDDVILPIPYYFNHEMAVVMAGARPVAVPTLADRQLDVEAIAAAITGRTRAVVTVSPNNPTGAVYAEESLRLVNGLCRDRGLFHIHDEAYEYFTYDGARHFSPGSIEGASAHTLSLYSLSKAYGMASWRVGYMVIPEALWDAVNKIQDTLIICAPVVSQRAAEAALDVGRAYAQSHLGALASMRAVVTAALDADDVPCDVPPAMGAFYLFPRVHTTLDPLALTERLIREHRVAVVPGDSFGDLGACSVRVSFGALDPSSVEEGARRLVRGLKAVVGS